MHHVNSNRELSDSQLSLFCSFVGRLNWAVQATRPDAAFNMIYLSTKMKNACEKDLVQVQKVIRCLQNNPLSTRYPKLCQYESCIVILLMHHMPISMKELAVSEHTLYFLFDSNNNCCLLTWHSNKIKRVVRSNLGAEGLSLCNGLEDAIQHRALLKELLNVNNFDLRILAFVDNKNLVESIYSTSLVENKRLRNDIGVIKEKSENKNCKIS